MEKTDDAAEELPQASASDRSQKLQTLSGAVALGAFLVLHLVTSAAALFGEAAYRTVLGPIGRSRVVPLFELVFVGIPLVFHAGNGLRLLRRKDSGAAARYGDGRAWLLQRISGAVVLVFVLGHFFELRFQRLFLGLSADAIPSTLTAHLSSTWASIPWVALLYVIGIGATAFHFANGLFAATATWNLATNGPERRRVRVATSAIGLVLFVLGTATVICLATGTRLLRAADADSAPCGSTVPTAAKPAPSP